VSRTGTAGRPTPDVFTAGAKVYPNATDQAALGVGVGFLAGKDVGAVVDPFCGRGSIAGAAAAYGLDAVSIDIDPELVDVEFQNYPLDQAFRSLSPGVRFYYRVDLQTFQVQPLRLALLSPASAQSL
jgi:predicted RNA methylase